MMSLKPRNIDFQETWDGLKETVDKVSMTHTRSIICLPRFLLDILIGGYIQIMVAGVVALQAIERGVWSARFSDIYALCVAHPEPLADRLYDETKKFLEDHVASLLEKVRGDDVDVGLLQRYVTAWREYSEGVQYLNNLYSYLNLQHIKRQKVSDAEIIYGSAAVSCSDHDSRQLEIGSLGLVIWELVLLRPLATSLTSHIIKGLEAARDNKLENHEASTLHHAILSTVQVQSFRARCPLATYEQLVLEPYLQAASETHAALAADLLADGDVSRYMLHALQGLDREMSLATRFLHPSSTEAARTCYEQSAVAAHLQLLHSNTERLMRRACERDGGGERDDVRRLYRLLRPLGPAALRPLVDAARNAAATSGRALLQAPSAPDAHNHFVSAMLSLHSTYTELFQDVFGGAQPFMGALDKACSEVVNSRPSPECPARAPELLARYCDCLLRKKNNSDDDQADEKLAAAIVVFKYVDDKDVFQKYYARALARRLIHQQCANMELEEAMINRLKAACGYEFTNKLHRMFTDVAVSADLNSKFAQLAPNAAPFAVQVLQAGAWPLGGGSVGGAPAALLNHCAQFDAWYRAAFSGRRLSWLYHLCTAELRTKYTPRSYHIACAAQQCGILLQFESEDRVSAASLRDALQLSRDCWQRHVKPLLDINLVAAEGDVLGLEPTDNMDGHLILNLNFICKRTKIKLTCASAPSSQGGSGGEPGSSSADGEGGACDDDRKMYLQAALVRIMKQRKVLRHTELVQEACVAARGSFAPSVALVKKCIEALIDKQYLERTPGAIDTYSYLA